MYKRNICNEYKKIQKTKKQNTPQSITNNSTTKNQAQEKEITKSQNTKKENNSTISSNKPKTGVKQVIENKTPQIINDKIQILNKQFKRDVDLLKQLIEATKAGEKYADTDSEKSYYKELGAKLQEALALIQKDPIQERA